MPFKPQKTQAVPVQVRLDFPQLPPAPRMTDPADNAAMAAYHTGLSAWYESMKTATLDKLNALAAEINNLKLKSN
jgi:hypothetical protein